MYSFFKTCQSDQQVLLNSEPNHYNYVVLFASQRTLTMFVVAHNTVSCVVLITECHNSHKHSQSALTNNVYLPMRSENVLIDIFVLTLHCIQHALTVCTYSMHLQYALTHYFYSSFTLCTYRSYNIYRALTQLHGMSTGKQRAPGWTTEMHCVIIIESYSLSGQFINVWCRNLRRAMKTEVIPTLRKVMASMLSTRC